MSLKKNYVECFLINFLQFIKTLPLIIVICNYKTQMDKNQPNIVIQTQLLLVQSFI